MSKNVLLGIVAFGGLILVVTLLPETPSTEDSADIQVEKQSSILPNEVTSRFPTYPNTTATSQDTSSDEDGRIFYSFSLESDASINEINEWYREALSKNGWSIKSDRDVAGYQIIQAEKENLFTSMQAANGQTSGTAVISQQAQVRPQE